MIRAYLQELDAALGTRLPADLKAQRLRESEGHLRMATAELGEAEAVRRYGPARRVANALVRADRGYDSAKTWRLAAPLYWGIVAGFLLESSLIYLLAKAGQAPNIVWYVQIFTLFYLVQFVYRVSKTRRWLFLPVAVAHFLCNGIGILAASSHLETLQRLKIITLVFPTGFLYWLAVNAIVLGVASLSDRRGIRRA